MKKWLLGVSVSLIVIIFGMVIFYRIIHQEQWALENTAVTTAVYSANLVKVNRVDRFVADQTYTIVFGEDAEGNERIVWVGKDEVHHEKVTDGVSVESIIEKVRNNDPANEIIRTIPGKMDHTYVWEVFYKRVDDTGTRYYYDYFQFRNGMYIDTYTLDKR